MRLVIDIISMMLSALLWNNYCFRSKMNNCWCIFYQWRTVIQKYSFNRHFENCYSELPSAWYLKTAKCSIFNMQTRTKWTKNETEMHPLRFIHDILLIRILWWNMRFIKHFSYFYANMRDTKLLECINSPIALSLTNKESNYIIIYTTVFNNKTNWKFFCTIHLQMQIYISFL